LDVYNRELWEFGVSIKTEIKKSKHEGDYGGIGWMVERVLTFLQCTSHPSSSHPQSLEHMHQYRITVSPSKSLESMTSFGTISEQRVVVAEHKGGEMI
jgi:hypothetical protein